MKKLQAFTLVELMVVIGIIALLISILIPALNKARQQASNTQCLANLHNISTGMAMYLNQNRGSFPFADGGTDVNGNAIHWGALISQTMGIGDGTIASASNSSVDSRRKIFICPDGKNFVKALPLNEYSAHPLLMPDTTLNYSGAVWGAMTGQARRPYRVNRVPNPSEIVLIADGVQSSADNSTLADLRGMDNQRISNTSASNPGVTYLLTDYCRANGIDLSQSVDGGPNTDDPTTNVNDRIYGNIRWRHLGNRAANFLYVDGHCGTLRYFSQLSTELKRRNICVPNP